MYGPLQAPLDHLAWFGDYQSLAINNMNHASKSSQYLHIIPLSLLLQFIVTGAIEFAGKSIKDLTLGSWEHVAHLGLEL